MSDTIEPENERDSRFYSDKRDAVLEYISQMAAELEKLCRDIEHPTVGAHLTLAAAEAMKNRSSNIS